MKVYVLVFCCMSILIASSCTSQNEEADSLIVKTTRGTGDFDNYQDCYDDFSIWFEYEADWEMYKLIEGKDNGMPEVVYQDFSKQMRDFDMWEGTEFNWENTAYVIEIRDSDSIGYYSIYKLYILNPDSYPAFSYCEWDEWPDKVYKSL